MVRVLVLHRSLWVLCNLFRTDEVLKNSKLAELSEKFDRLQEHRRSRCCICCSNCEWEGVVVGDEAPLGGVAQVVSHGVKVVGVHGEEGQEKDEEVRGEVKGEVEENQGQTLIMACR